MTFAIQAETQAELTAKTVIAEAILSISLYDFTPEMFRAAQLAEALVDMSDSTITWHSVFDERNMSTAVGFQAVLDDLTTFGSDNVNPDALTVSREFGALMLQIDLEARERVLDLAEAVATKVSLQSAANAVYEALKGAGVLA